VINVKLEKSITVGRVAIKSFVLPPVDKSSSRSNPNNKESIGREINKIFLIVKIRVI
jgi:hypothetical protein